MLDKTASRWKYVGRVWLLIGGAVGQIAEAAPTTVLQRAAETQSAPASTSTASSPSSNRDSSFEILADGTQDLAALVGLFATNSVEAKAIDYSKGFLSTCAATLSLLGLLGYTKTMVKLGLGRERCERAGFSTSNLRLFYGVSEADRVPESKTFTVRCIQRSEVDGEVVWTRLRELQHTTDSMLLVKAAVTATNDRKAAKNHEATISRWQVTKRRYLTTRAGIAGIACTFALFNFMTCFSILLFRGPQSTWTWSTYFSTFGLFTLLTLGCWLWLWMFVREHLPIRSRRAEYASEELFIDGPHSVAYAAIDGSYHCMWYRPVSNAQRQVVRFLSVFVAGGAVVGYICQYIEVRQTYSVQSGYWLALQAALAAIRIMIWVHDPGFDNPEMGCTSRPAQDFGELHHALAFFSREPDDILRYPAWSTPVYRLNATASRETLRESFGAAVALVREPDGRSIQDMLLDSETKTWDMPAQVFRTWLRIFVPDADTASFASLESFTLRLLLSRERALVVLPALALTWRFGAATLALRRVLSLTTPGAAIPKALLFATALPRTTSPNDAVMGVPTTEPWPNLLMTDEAYLFTWSMNLDRIMSYWARLGDPKDQAKAEEVLGMTSLMPLPDPRQHAGRLTSDPPLSPTFASRPVFTTMLSAQPEVDAGEGHAEIGAAPPGVEGGLLRNPTEHSNSSNGDGVDTYASSAGGTFSRRASAGLRRASRRASLPIVATVNLPMRTFEAMFSSRLVAPSLDLELQSSGRALLDRMGMQRLAHASMRGLWEVLGAHAAWPPDFAAAAAEMAQREAALELSDARRNPATALTDASVVESPATTSLDASWTADALAGPSRADGARAETRADAPMPGLPELQEEAQLAQLELLRERNRAWNSSSVRTRSPTRRGATWEAEGEEA